MDFSLPQIACRVTTERCFGWVVEITRLGTQCDPLHIQLTRSPVIYAYAV